MALRMMQGTGQEAPPDTLLSCPVSVVVEDQDGKPVKDQEVRFTVAHSPKDQVFEITGSTNPAQNKKEVIAKSDADGAAYARWYVAGDEGCHGLKAELVNPPQNDAAPVWFSARVHRLDAGEVGYKAGCKFLQDEKADTVEKALNALCGREAQKPDLPKVVKVSWQNDAPLALSDFVKGLRVDFDRPMVTDLISPDTFILTWEEPVGEWSIHEPHSRWRCDLRRAAGKRSSIHPRSLSMR